MWQQGNMLYLPIMKSVHCSTYTHADTVLSLADYHVMTFPVQSEETDESSHSVATFELFF